MPPIFTIPIFSDAPFKPALGAVCNGCGVCCLLEPCPLGVLLSGRFHGACRALRWQTESMQYRCGAIVAPHELIQSTLAPRLRRLTPLLVWLLERFARRWVAAGTGCDCDVQLDEASHGDAEN